MWRIPGVDGQVIINQGYQSHWDCQSYLAGDTRGKWMNKREVCTPYDMVRCSGYKRPSLIEGRVPFNLSV